jgi:hypothetical protein
MPPVQMLDIGRTSKSRTELQSFLATLHSRVNSGTYDLIRNNCNNFSDTVSQFLTGERVPSYIVDLADIVFNTPGGRMLRPMIENMSNSVYSQQNNGITGSFPPTAAIAVATSSATIAASVVYICIYMYICIRIYVCIYIYVYVLFLILCVFLSIYMSSVSNKLHPTHFM